MYVRRLTYINVYPTSIKFSLFWISTYLNHMLLFRILFWSVILETNQKYFLYLIQKSSHLSTKRLKENELNVYPVQSSCQGCSNGRPGVPNLVCWRLIQGDSVARGPKLFDSQLPRCENAEHRQMQVTGNRGGGGVSMLFSFFPGLCI
jgi:hypothetical protein